MLIIYSKYKVFKLVQHSMHKILSSRTFDIFKSMCLLSNNTLKNKENADLIHEKKFKFASSIKNEIPVNLLIDHLKTEIRSKDILVEFFPGKGILTKSIVKTFNNKLLLFQPSKSLKNSIKTSFPNNLTQVIFSDIEFQNFMKYFYISKRFWETEKHKEYVKFLRSHFLKNQSSNLIIVGTICYFNFFHTLIEDFVHRAVFFHDNLKPKFYLFVPYHIYLFMLKLWPCGVKNRTLGIPYKLYFNVKLLGHAPKNSFIYSNILNKIKWNKKNKLNENFFLLKITPKNYNYIKQKAENDIIGFNYFMNQLIRMKNCSNLMLILDSFLPGCVEECIKKGFRVLDHPSDLSEDKWYDLFKTFKSHPEYNSSFYLVEMKKSLRWLQTEESELMDEKLENNFKDYDDDVLVDDTDLPDDTIADDFFLNSEVINDSSFDSEEDFVK